MKREFLLFASSTVICLLLTGIVIKSFFPQLVSTNTDLQLVQIDKKVPAYFEHIFRLSDYNAQKFILQDPITRVRAAPLFDIGPNASMGPNDLLGFRNKSIPNKADVVFIGDSQTYGNNASINENWPAHFLKNSVAHSSGYSMSVGGWAALQYFYMSKFTVVFNPKTVIIAFYSGNDSLESFGLAYASAYWQDFRIDPNLTSDAMPKVNFPPKEEEIWGVRFDEGDPIAFTPTLRLSSNANTPAAMTGWKIMMNTMQVLDDSLKGLGSSLKTDFFVTVIPTKELTYSERIKRDFGQKQLIDPIYQTLVEREQANIELFQQSMQSLTVIKFIDVVEPLKNAALLSLDLYPRNPDGHPLPEGYQVIGRSLAREVYSLKNLEAETK